MNQDEENIISIEEMKKLMNEHIDEKSLKENEFKGELIVMSFFDLEKEIKKEKQNSHLNEDRWDKFKFISQKVNQDAEVLRKEKIIKLLKESDEEQQGYLDGKKFSWLDKEELNTAQKELSSLQEKNAAILKNVSSLKDVLKINDFSIFNELDKELPNFKEVTRFYRGSFALNQSREDINYQAPRPILLLGDPGIGKTHYAKKLSKLLNTNYVFLDANSISANWVLSGSSGSWKDAKPGLIFKEMAKSKTMSPLIVFDEIDKLSDGKNYDTMSTFHQLLEKENAKEFFDEHLELKFNASQIIYVLTANDAQNIPESLLSRMNVFHVNNPSKEEMVAIVQNIYKGILAESKLFKPKLAPEEVQKLVGFSPREVHQIISKNIFNQASDIKMKKSKSKSLVISELKYEKKSMGFK